MIRIRRGHEPAYLRPIRDAALLNARGHHAAGTLDKDTLGRDYDATKGDLCGRQYFKCCYCERNNIEPGYNDVEHYRPKLRADRGAGFPTHGYWWLAWTWQNLMFACPNCNRSEKNDGFPLSVGSTPLVHEQHPPGLENALLIDPCTDNPVDHIKFTFHGGLPQHRWRPLPRNGSPEGDATIRVLGLGRPSLLDLYENHVNIYINPIINRIRAEIVANNRAGVSAIWTNEAIGWLDPKRPFTGLSYDALDHYVSLADRRSFSLHLLRPR